MTTPTDAELQEAYDSVPAHGDQQVVHIAGLRAVLAKWGALRAEKIVIPTDTMEQEFQKHYRRGYEAGKKVTTTQPTQTQDEALIRQLVEALEMVEKAMPFPVAQLALKAAHARLKEHT